MPSESINHVAELSAKTFAFFPTLKAVMAALGAALGYFLPSSALQDTVVVAILLVLADTITGTVAAWQTGNAIKSAKFARVLAKLLVYSMVTGSVSVAMKVMPGAHELRESAVMGVLFLVITTELISVIENADKMGLAIVPTFVRNLVRDQAERLRKG